MIDAILRWSPAQRAAVIGLAATLLVWGAWNASRMPVDVFPDLTPPTVTILAEEHRRPRGAQDPRHLPHRDGRQRRTRGAARDRGADLDVDAAARAGRRLEEEVLQGALVQIEGRRDQ